MQWKAFRKRRIARIRNKISPTLKVDLILCDLLLFLALRNAQGTVPPITQDISEMIDCDSFCASEENTRERLQQKKSYAASVQA